ncbi:uncharacterized protein IUM83_04752 [Phytophthora cinnamomi]|uniref:uncharacterized protein n=1 Tax=Phytophthora cinnamomi TaxID=4785 RepID=UPI0035595E9D|nr:hypothetical protein IUM83_04752 [Phytophthora cinnamomi]
MAEFLILLKYVEVVIPLVFTIYLIATYQMPNRAYYAVFDGMDQSLLIQTLGHVMFYCSLQLVSLLFLIAKLQCMLGIRPTRQLAFVLDKQFHWVQTSLIVWAS